jgi:hypothetical protein
LNYKITFVHLFNWQNFYFCNFGLEAEAAEAAEVEAAKEFKLHLRVKDILNKQNYKIKVDL